MSFKQLKTTLYLILLKKVLKTPPMPHPHVYFPTQNPPQNLAAKFLFLPGFGGTMSVQPPRGH